MSSVITAVWASKGPSINDVSNKNGKRGQNWIETAYMGEIGSHKPSKQLPTSFMDGPLKPKNCKGSFRNYVAKNLGSFHLPPCLTYNC